MASSKNTIFCTKCGKKNGTSSTYCTGCGAKLINPRKIAEEDPERKREEEKRLNQVTLENMTSKISSATFIVAKVIVKSSIISLKPKQPDRYDTYSTKAFVILDGSLRFASDVDDDVKKKILEDLETDMDINQVDWTTSSLASLRLRDKGWNAVACSGAQWYVWPVNGSTIKSLVTVDYTGKTPNRTIVKGRVYSQDEIKHDQSSETVWAIIGFIAIVLFIIFLMTR